MSDTTNAGHGHGGEHGGMGHAVPWPILVGVWIGLMVLTVITVAVTYVDLGALNIIIAMGVATMKATLVVAFFMHLFWDKPLNTVTFLLSVAFVAVFLAFTIIDTKQNKAAIDQRNLDFVTVVVEEEKPVVAGAAWTPPTISDDEEKAIVERIKVVVAGGTGDAAAGKAIFVQRCATCHKLGGEGAEVGPELDSFDRTNKERLVYSIGAPNLEIRKGYENYLYKPKGAAPVMMVKVSEDEKTVTGRDATSKSFTFEKDNLKERDPKPLKASLMPMGLFDNLSEDEVRNLMAYIQSFPITPAPAAAPAPAPAK